MSISPIGLGGPLQTLSALGGMAPKTGKEEESASTETAESTASDPLRSANGALGDQEEDLSTEEQQQVRQLKQRDQEVRRHEQAHVAAGGGYVQGGARLKYTTGPDGKRYATGGDVRIEVGTERTPEATIRKMQQVQRAALAPARPSAQDRTVYRQAANQEAAARQELAERRTRDASGEAPGADRAEQADAAGESEPMTPSQSNSGASPLARAAIKAYNPSQAGETSPGQSGLQPVDQETAGPTVQSLDLRI